MSRGRKLSVVAGISVLAGAGAFAAYRYSQRGIVTVQTGQVSVRDLAAIVSASGEVKPRNYINIGANVMGRITSLEVQEGDRVRKHQVVARLESIQAEADLEAQRAALRAAEAESSASEASLKAADHARKTAEAGIDRAKAELERARSNFSRTEKLFEEKLIARQQYDQARAEFQALEAAVREAEARLAQSKAQREQTLAQLSGTQRRVSQLQATLRRFRDVLQKHSAVSPIDGVVTNLPVRVGETVVPGIQNSPASLIMTIADMSLITGEVKVDETDIVNVKLGQQAEVSIDAMSDTSFRGQVIEIGNTAILRSTGLAASQSAISSQEAKDFRVVIALENPPEGIRPGLSCSAKITTATRDQALAIPIQALTTRNREDLKESPAAGANPTTGEPRGEKEEVVGVFVTSGDRAVFRPVKTGIIGATEIEVRNGLEKGEEILTGSYKVLRTLRSGARIKVDNKPVQRPAS